MAGTAHTFVIQGPIAREGVAGVHDVSGRRLEPGPEDETLFGSFQRVSAGLNPEQRALVGLRNGHEWLELSYGALLRDVTTVSENLAALGVGHGDVVCLQLPNWTEAVIYTYAASRLGAVVCPITTIYRQRELSYILELTDCHVLVVPSTYRKFDYASMAAKLRTERPELRHVICVGDAEVPDLIDSRQLLEPVDASEARPKGADADDIAVLAFTSGTTGESKGVMHTHRSMHAAIDDFVSHAGFASGLTSLVMSPFGHLTGFTWGILMPLRGGGDVVLLEAWDAERALDLMERYSVNFTMGATPFLTDLLEAAQKRSTAAFPEVFVCAGAPIPPSLIEHALTRHATRVVSGWGMSEYPIGTSTTVTDDPALASSSDGRPAGRAEVVIVDPDLAAVGVGHEGDLIIRGPGLFKGYYKRPNLDADAFTDDGYLRTGDRARLLDGAGHIRISGRTKDIIIRGGENIPVVEIENLLITHPAIKEIAIVPLQHDRLGETACACVVTADGHTPISLPDMAEFLRERGVATQFFPEAIRIVEELPRTPSGKIQKFALRQLVLEKHQQA